MENTDSATSSEKVPHAPAYTWKFITDEFIDSPGTLKNNLIKQIVNEDIAINDVLYEILLSVSEYPTRTTQFMFIQLTSEIFANYNNQFEKYALLANDFMLLAQSFNMNKSLSKFLKDCTIDKRFKILHLDKSVLRSEGIFPEYGKYQYNDARSRIFSVDTFSSLHEASEGYSKFISQLYIYLEHQSEDYENIPSLIDVLNRLMAKFNLDNNRCFLLILNILSTFLETKTNFVLEIFKKSLWWKPCEYNNTVQTVVVDYLLNYVGTECKELKLITLLIKENVLEFDSIYNCLGPLDVEISDSANINLIENSEIEELYKMTQEKLKEDAQISNASALALAAPLLPDSDDEDDTASSSYKKPEKPSEKEVEDQKQTSILEKAKLFRKVQFLEYLIDFQMDNDILSVLVQYPQIPLIYDSIADKLNSLIDDLIAPFYFQFVDNLNITDVEVKQVLNENVYSIDSFLVTVNRYLPFLKYKLARSSRLLTKIIRIVRTSLESNLKDKEFWLQFHRLFIFPCLSFCNNIPVVNESFDILNKFYSMETRYNLYGEYQIIVKKDMITKLNFDTAEKKTRDILKRLSVENVTVSCRVLNKLVSINPIATSNAFISHIESYSSLINLVCESSKFFNDFAWDVITYQILNKLNSNRMVMQSDGLNYSQWFINLSQFIGNLGKFYPSSFQLSPILLDIVKSLLSGDSDILGLLKELLDSMTGIKSITNLTTKQIMRMNAEQSLRQLAYISIQDEREQCGRSSNKLLKVLIDDNIFSELFILLCQVPISLIDKADDKPLKFVNQRCDDVTSLIHRLISTFDLNLKTSVFKSTMCSIPDLIEKFKILPQWVFEIWRRHLARDIKLNNNGSVGIFENLKKSFMNSLTQIDWDILNPQFYLTFWQLSLYDINFKDLSYMMEYSELRSQITGISMKLRRQNELTTKEKNNLEGKHKQLLSVLKYIKEDMNTHESNYKLIQERLEEEKSSWFLSDDAEGIKNDEVLNKRSVLFLQHCAFPRLQHSSFDAVFVSKFIFFIENLKTPGYSLKHVLHNLFMLNILPLTLYTNTTNETENLGLFYQLVLEKLDSWRLKQELFESECPDLGKEVDHKSYCSMLYNWSSNLLKQILQSLDSESYTTRSNAISFLKVLLNNFPVIEEQSDLLSAKLEEIVANDTRDDIKLASRALIGLIKFRYNKLIPVWEFYEMKDEDKKKAMEIREKRLQEEKKHEEEEHRKKVEEERKEQERSRLQNAATAMKPYGLVGLANKKPSESVKKGAAAPAKESKDEKSVAANNETRETSKEPNDSSKELQAPSKLPTGPAVKATGSTQPSVDSGFNASPKAAPSIPGLTNISATDSSSVPTATNTASKVVSSAAKNTDSVGAKPPTGPSTPASKTSDATTRVSQERPQKQTPTEPQTSTHSQQLRHTSSVSEESRAYRGSKSTSASMQHSRSASSASTASAHNTSNKSNYNSNGRSGVNSRDYSRAGYNHSNAGSGNKSWNEYNQDKKYYSSSSTHSSSPNSGISQSNNRSSGSNARLNSGRSSNGNTTNKNSRSSNDKSNGNKSSNTSTGGRKGDTSSYNSSTQQAKYYNSSNERNPYPYQQHPGSTNSRNPRNNNSRTNNPNAMPLPPPSTPPPGSHNREKNKRQNSYSNSNGNNNSNNYNHPNKRPRR